MSIDTMELTATEGLRPHPVGTSWLRLWQSIGTRDAVLLEARAGRWHWPWALLSTILAIGAAGTLAMLVTGSDWASEFANDVAFDPQRPSSFLIVLMTFLPLIIVPCVLTRYLHRISWHQLLARSGRFEWRVYLRAVGAFFVVAAAMTGLDYTIDPKAYRLLHRGIDFVPWIVMGMAVLFLQTLAEEIFFRGYLLRMWGAVLPYRLVITSGLVAAFTWGHVENTDIKADFWFNVLNFALVQCVWCYIWLRTQSVAATAGLHWANNVTAFCILAPVPGWSPTLAIATDTDAVVLNGGSHLLDPYAWATSLLGLGLLVMLLVWRRSPFRLPAQMGFGTAGMTAGQIITQKVRLNEHVALPV